MKVRPELAEVDEDLKTAEPLFEGADFAIRDALRAIDSFLAELEAEFVEKKPRADSLSKQVSTPDLDRSIKRLGLT